MTDYLDLSGWTTARIHRPAKKEVIAIRAQPGGVSAATRGGNTARRRNAVRPIAERKVQWVQVRVGLDPFG